MLSIWKHFLLQLFTLSVKVSLPPSGSAQAPKSGRKVQSWPLAKRERSSGIWVGRGGRRRLRGGRDAMLRWHVACLFKDWRRLDSFTLSNRPLKSSLSPLSKSLQVGLERWGLLFQGEETLLHFVKLRAGRRAVSPAGFPVLQTTFVCLLCVPAQCWPEAAAPARPTHCCGSRCCSHECDSRLVPVKHSRDWGFFSSTNSGSECKWNLWKGYFDFKWKFTRLLLRNILSTRTFRWSTVCEGQSKYHKDTAAV